VLRDTHNKVNRLANQAEFIAKLGHRVQNLHSRLEVERHELQLWQSTELQRLRDELNDRTVSLKNQIEALAQALADVESAASLAHGWQNQAEKHLTDLETTASSVQDWQRQAEKHLAAITTSLEAAAPRATVEGQAAQLREVANGLASVLERFAARPYMSTDAYGASGDLSAPMGFGLDAEHTSTKQPEFEDLFRGRSDFIAERQRVYLPFMQGKADVVDLGCGRGEFLDLLRSVGIEGRGVELDQRLVTASRERGLNVVLLDVFEYLEQQPDGSLDAIFSAQLIEHLEPRRLPELLALGRRKLRPRGLFIAETVNPESYLGFKTFYVDVSHQLPIYPQVLLYLCQKAGYLSARIFYPQGGGFTQESYTTAGEYAVFALT
jgi:SAM-dependent methyltransferase